MSRLWVAGGESSGRRVGITARLTWKLSFAIAIGVIGVMLLSSMSMVSLPARISSAGSSTSHSSGPINSPISTGNGCIIAIPSGSTVVNSTTVTFADGTLHYYQPSTCQLSDSSTIVTLPTINGWIESATDHYGDGSSTGFTAISGTWTVPPAPTTIGTGNNNQGQVIFLFNSIQGYSSYFNQNWIIQPVLTWGCSTTNSGGCVFGRQGWWIDSWIVWQGGPTYVTNEIDVSVGDLIHGYMYPGTDTLCAYTNTAYYIIANDTTNNLYNNFDLERFCQGNTDGYGTEGDAGALEVYYLDTCSMLPAADSLTFQGITSTPTETSWGHDFINTTNPSCNYQITSNSDSASLYFGPTIKIYTYSVNDNYCRSIGLTFDQALPVPWWPPYQSGYEIGTPSSQGGNCGSLTYYTTPNLTPGNHYLQTAVSGFVSSYEWYTTVYVNGNVAGQGYVGRNQILSVNFSV